MNRFTLSEPYWPRKSLASSHISSNSTASLVMVITGLALLLSAQAAQADYLYGINWDTDETYIFTLDTDTGEMAKYYGHPVDDISALDFDSSGQLYALTTHALFRIDIGFSDEDTTVIAGFGLPF